MSLYNEDTTFKRTLFDPETGLEDEESLLSKQDLYIKDAIARGEALKQLQSSDGYRILKNWLELQITNYKESLVDEQDITKIHRLQVAIRCYRNVLDAVFNGVQEAVLLKQHQDNLADS